MSIFITRKAKGSPALSKALVRKLAAAMLAELGLPEAELSLLLTDDRTIQEINSQHREKDKPTDVLSFPQNEFSKPMVPRRGSDLSLLGDVVISLDTALRQATSRKRDLESEVRFLLAHGILHLVGYDHMNAAEKAVMTKRTRELVKAAARATFE